MKGSYVHAEELSVGYNGKALIEHIGFSLGKGEILTLIGPNGAGKSTILKTIARQLELLFGTVVLDGVSLSSLSGKALSKKMAVVLTERLRTELMTCREVVSTGRYPYTGRFGVLSKADAAAVTEAMELVQVTSIADREFTQISDGQRQRVMLARAICQEPEVLVLDEPTSFLDVKYKLEFLSVLQSLRREKRLTVLMSLHELELAQRVSDYLLCVKGDHIDRFGTPEEIFQPGYLRTLFSITSGSFDEDTTTMELEKPSGTPRVFVLAGNGSGRHVYRKLQRQGIPFATGILFQNDLDFPVARALSDFVISAESFAPIPLSALTAAKDRLDRCETLLCCRNTFGPLEQENQKLLDYGKSTGKTVRFLTEQEGDGWQKY